MKSLNRDLPNIYDLECLKREIAKLTHHEADLSGETRTEYHLRLAYIFNLFRVVRAEVMNHNNQPLTCFSNIQNELLRSNWGKLNKSMMAAESFYG